MTGQVALDWNGLREYQKRAITATREAYRAGRRAILLVSPTGCHAPGQGVLMHDGSVKRAEDVHVGDSLMGPDSSPRGVVELHTGVDEMVQIQPVKGAPWTVNAGHILSLVRTNDGTNKDGSIIDVPVSEWASWSRTHRHIHKLFRSEAEFPAQRLGLWGELPVDPYILGVLLGDGSLTTSVAVTTADIEVERAVVSYAELLGMTTRYYPAGGSSQTIYIVGKHEGRDARGWPTATPIMSRLRDAGVWGMGCADKSIPAAYRCGSRSVRLEVLAGLIDTDGSFSNGTFDFVSKSLQLATDVSFIARSLGLAAYVHECTKGCQTGATGTYYRVCVSGDTAIVPCRIPRKRAPERRQKKDVLRTGFGIVPAGHGEFFGFAVEGDGRYLLDDFTVTHNSGKTRIGSYLGGNVIAKGRSAAWYVHRDELAQQAREAFERIGVRAGIVAGSTNSDPGAPFQVISIQTAVVRGLSCTADIVFIDEAHHVGAEIWGGPFRDARARGVPIIGVTATPDRGDGVGLDGVFDCLIPVAQPHELIALGHLVPCTVIGPTRKTRALWEHPVAAYRAYLAGRQTIVFANTVAYARKLADQFNACGIAAACVDGKMSAETRRQAIDDFRSRKLLVLTSVQVLTEGFDAPETSGVILAGGCSVPSALIQKVGRAMRPAPWIGKTNCIVLDLRGSCRDLAMLPDDDRVYSLEGRAIKARDGLDPIRTCPECGACFHVGLYVDRTCPACGFQTRGQVDPAIRRQAREAYNASMPAEERIVFLADQMELAMVRAARGERYKTGPSAGKLRMPYKDACQAYTIKFGKRYNYNGPHTRACWPSKEQLDSAMQLVRERREQREAKAGPAQGLLAGVG